MVDVLNFNEFYFNPDCFEGLEEVVIFPDGEHKYHSGVRIPNSSVWRFGDAPYHQQILGLDVGCGIAGWLILGVDVPGAMDAIADHLKGTGVLGRGNHFVELLEGISSKPETHILLIHSNGRIRRRRAFESYDAAATAMVEAENSRAELGCEIIDLLGTNGEMIGNWTHNSVERSESGFIYRKGAVKVQLGKLHVLPAHLGADVYFYVPDPDSMPPLDSLPHGTGRLAGRGALKVDLDQVKALREMVYIPDCIRDTSLRTEHPSCFNGYSGIFKHLHGHVIGIRSSRILGYVGKI